MTPEFSRTERVDQIGAAERVVRIAADERERAGLARRFDLIGIDRLEAEYAVRAEAGGVVATGLVAGEVVQPCAATGEPLHVSVDEAVSLRFVADALPGEEEVELSADALDTLPIEGGLIDLGEAAAETLALALDPFARIPDADTILAQAGVIGENEASELGREASPFAGLADLKRKLEG